MQERPVVVWARVETPERWELKRDGTRWKQLKRDALRASSQPHAPQYNSYSVHVVMATAAAILLRSRLLKRH
jgi:hypothetical protein